jgi:hypothetical protein
VTILEDPPDPHRSRNRFAVVVGALLLVLVVAAAAWLLSGRQASPPARTAPAPVAAVPPAEKAPEPAAPTVETPTPSRRARKAPASETPAPAEPAAPTLALKINSDVPGADVFIDRVYVGKAPLETHDVKPGSHTLNVSAEGYESQSLPVEVADGMNEVNVQFKVVRLNETIQVVHKHTIGSCEGRLLADPHGLRYETSNKDHAFDIPFSQVQSFTVDYLQKNLRLTRKDGKTFNFTDRNPNADALFVFHKKVEAARAKLKDAGH